MGDIREFVFTALILFGGFLVAPLVIDNIPYLSMQATTIKVVLCFVFSLSSLVAVIFLWAILCWLLDKKG